LIDLKSLRINKNNGIEIGQEVVFDGGLTRDTQNLLAISHAHEDHGIDEIPNAVSEFGASVVMTEATKELLGTRINSRTDSTYVDLEYNEDYQQDKIKINFLDANHMLGSAQIRLEHENFDWSVGYSGDIGSNVERPIDVDVLFLDSSHSSFFDQRPYSQKQAIKELSEKIKECIAQEKSFNLVAHSGLLQYVVDALTEYIPNIWELYPEVIGGGADYTKKRSNLIKHYCEVYERWGFEQPKVLSRKSLDNDEKIHYMENTGPVVRLFNRSADIQNNISTSFVIRLNKNQKSPLVEFDNSKGYNVSFSSHETGDTLRQYIERVNPKIVITDGHRNNKLENAEKLTEYIKEKIGIDSITSFELNELH
jgi:Cft2 family RNA processing exonuclease